MRRVLNKGVTLLAICAFIYAAANLGIIGYDYWKNNQVLAEAQMLYRENGKSTMPLSEQNKQANSFKSLQQINNDIIGWIAIEDTEVDYPVLQADDNEYYLNRNYKGSETRAGSIFMDYRNSFLGHERNTILYGHRMKDGSMFSGLSKFTDQSFFQERHDVYFDTVSAQYDVEIFSVYNTNTDFYYIETDFEDDRQYGDFLSQIQERSMYKANVAVSTDDQIITFSTCDYTLHPTNGRLVVHGKLVKVDD